MEAINKEMWIAPSSFKEAVSIQKEMVKKISIKDELPKQIKYIAGLDVSNNPFDPEKKIYASISVLSYPDLEVVEVANYSHIQPFPYISGLLAFREVPALLQAYRKLKIKPDILFVDGHGISHPRGIGIASHIGVILNLPAIGVAKSILCGSAIETLGQLVYSQSPLVNNNQTIAMLYRSKKRCLPLIISAGHKITLDTSMKLVKETLKGYKLPEPTRWAHFFANKFRKNRI